MRWSRSRKVSSERRTPKTFPVITLTTDFGASFYVGQMKGVLAALVPQARVIDLTHEIEPQSILQGAMVLQDSIHWFPRGSIHIAVVDPGVGTQRRLVAAEFDGQIVIGPDNGLLSALAEDTPPTRIVHLNKPEYWSHLTSSTFHGRDIMAPIASRIASGVQLESLGDPLLQLEPSLIQPVCRSAMNEIEGVTCVADRFGNLLTNIRQRDLITNHNLDATRKWSIHLQKNGSEGWTEVPFVHTYGDAKSGEVVALFGSAGRLEICVPNGDARNLLGGVVFPLRVAKRDS